MGGCGETRQKEKKFEGKEAAFVVSTVEVGESSAKGVGEPDESVGEMRLRRRGGD